MPTGSIKTSKDFAEAFEISRENVDRLQSYADLLRHWSKVQDLVAPSTLDDVWSRHFADSAQLAALAPTATSWLDLGSGAGFPGLVVAILIAGRPHAKVHLVESNGRKCAFLREVARATGAPVEIHDQRIESMANQGIGLGRVNVVSARALAPLGKLLMLARPFFADDTVGLFLKGRETASEIEAASKDWTFESVAHVSRTDPDGRIVEVRQLAAR